MSYPKTPLTARIVKDVLQELNYMYPLIFCETLAGKLNVRIANETEANKLRAALESLVLFSKPTKTNAAALNNAHRVLGNPTNEKAPS